MNGPDDTRKAMVGKLRLKVDCNDKQLAETDSLAGSDSGVNGPRGPIDLFRILANRPGGVGGVYDR